MAPCRKKLRKKTRTMMDCLITTMPQLVHPTEFNILYTSHGIKISRCEGVWGWWFEGVWGWWCEGVCGDGVKVWAMCGVVLVSNMAWRRHIILSSLTDGREATPSQDPTHYTNQWDSTYQSSQETTPPSRQEQGYPLWESQSWWSTCTTCTSFFMQWCHDEDIVTVTCAPEW